MRKCEKCGASMKLDLRLKVNGGGYGMVVRVDEKQKLLQQIFHDFLLKVHCIPFRYQAAFVNSFFI